MSDRQPDVNADPPPRSEPDNVDVLMHRALDLGLAFKRNPEIYGQRQDPKQIRDALLAELPEAETSLDATLASFADEVLPLCKNEASPHFLGFGDTGDDPAALVGGILALLTQQNLINQSFDSPSGRLSRSRYCGGCGICSGSTTRQQPRSVRCGTSVA